MLKALSVNHQRTMVVLAMLLGLIGVLTACGGSAAPAPAAQVQGLDTSYANALDARTQLLLGTIRLEEGSGPALSKEQATTLVPLWQTFKSLVASGTASQAELDAVTNQIAAAMTTEQLEAIKAMRLTQADMQTLIQTLGVTPPQGVVPGQGQNLSPQERATRQAQFGGTGNSTASMDYLLGLLQRKAGKRLKIRTESLSLPHHFFTRA
jgi:hypothetical protein